MSCGKFPFHLFALFTLMLHSLSISQNREIPEYELGMLLGEPTGISAKYWFNEQLAVDAALAWSFGEGFLGIYADYLYHPIRLGNRPFYIGAGVSLRAGQDWFAGIRFPIGAETFTDWLPVSFFAEFAPRLELIPPGAGFGGGGGIRWNWGTATDDED
ncbi:MAG: hypothetical protein ACOCXC_03045 [Fibrobacterota bacterium]